MGVLDSHVLVFLVLIFSQQRAEGLQGGKRDILAFIYMAFGKHTTYKVCVSSKIKWNLKTSNSLRLFLADHKTNTKTKCLNEHLMPHGYLSEKGVGVYLHLKNLCLTNPTSIKGTWTIESDLRQFLTTKISFDYYFLYISKVDLKLIES